MIIPFFYGVNAYSQIVRVDDFGLDSPVKYSARDSIVMDVPAQIIRLYGNADVKYEEINLSADLIEIDIEKSEVQATYSTDSLGNKIGKPFFTDGTEEVTCDAMRYNFKSEKAIIQEVRTQQADGYIHMEFSKRLPNEEIHFKNGKYTTCDKENPHYHFQLSKAIVIPGKRIVTGPIHMRILNIPMPIAFPFSFLPNSDTRKHGLILPSFSLAGNYGSGLENLGYYFPINNKLENYVYGTVYTSGRWAVSDQLNYNNKYKYSGTVKLGFEHLQGFFYEESIANNYTVYWNHSQATKAHPSLRFGANIDFRSNNDASQTIEIIPENVFNTAFNSAINLNKSWKLDQFSGTWSGKLSLQQNSETENFVMELPSFNLSVNRFDLGVLRKNKIGKKWYENIAITYTASSLNRVTVNDSVASAGLRNADLSFIADNSTSGIKQHVVVQTNLKPKSGWFNFNLNTTYDENWNFQSIENYWNPLNQSVDTNFMNGFKTARSVSFSGSLNTNLYGYLKTNFANKLKFRHVMTPNISFTYRPDIGEYQLIQIDTAGNTGYFSPFSASLYNEQAKGASGLINYSLANILEMKKLDKADTINNTFKSFKLIDRFNISGSYDLLRDSLNLSNFIFSMQTTPIKMFSIQAGWTLNPYAYSNETGITNSNYAWNNAQGIGRVTSANFAVNGRYGTKRTKSDTLRNLKNSVFNINFQYNINYSRNSNGIVQQDTFGLTHTIRVNGDLELWKLWSFDYDIMTDLMTLLSNPNPSVRIGVKRELHCWETSLSFTKTNNFFAPMLDDDNNTSPNYVIRFKINIKASMFNAFLPELTPRIPQTWYTTE
ncbi:hypothetical protein DNU06_07665 [Putridiphycobacter roseus]|uniref:LPS-assembly protein LptD central domain-containing protein n=1 Tax=Putridiphycobacter roseus TaxID=2219161 RepID=A0A2W1NSP2_9FLAO|nr:hypothetical protein DNU06_07665 [Putridiphycobacter roseus]